MKTRHHIAAIIGGLGIGAFIVTVVGKTIMEAGIAVLTTFAAIGTGILAGKVAFPRKSRKA